MRVHLDLFFPQRLMIFFILIPFFGTEPFSQVLSLMISGKQWKRLLVTQTAAAGTGHSELDYRLAHTRGYRAGQTAYYCRLASIRGTRRVQRRHDTAQEPVKSLKGSP